jgi:hypothetical protein
MKLFKKSSNVPKNVNNITQNQQNIAKLFFNYLKKIILFYFTLHYFLGVQFFLYEFI